MPFPPRESKEKVIEGELVLGQEGSCLFGGVISVTTGPKIPKTGGLCV